MALNRENRQGYYGEAFFQAIVSAAGMTAQKQSDSDIYLTDFEVGHPGARGRLLTPKLGVQVKSSRNARLTRNEVKYKLKSKYYNKLAIPAYRWSNPTFLVVVRVPEDPADWMRVSQEHLELRHAAYWTYLHGMPQRNDLAPESPVTVSVPRANLLTTDALGEMFDIAERLRFEDRGVVVP